MWDVPRLIVRYEVIHATKAKKVNLINCDNNALETKGRCKYITLLISPLSKRVIILCFIVCILRMFFCNIMDMSQIVIVLKYNYDYLN